MSIDHTDQRLIKNNRTACESFEYLISILSNASIDSVWDSLYKKLDATCESRKTDGLPEIDSTAAMSIGIISELANLVCAEVNHIEINTTPKKVVGIWSPFEILIMGVDHLEEEDLTLLRSKLKDCNIVKELLYDFFVNMHDRDSAFSMFLQEVGRFGGFKALKGMALDSDMDFAIDRAIRPDGVSKNLTIKAFIAFIVNQLLLQINSTVSGFVRVTKKDVEVIVYSENEKEVVLTNKKGGKVDYYHVTYRSFSDNGKSGYGTISVRCHDIFSQGRLQEIICRKIRMDTVLINDWQVVKNKKQYLILNDLQH